MALKIFRLRFLEDNIPSLNNFTDNFVREAYYGGATDYYKKQGKNLWYYDVNSMYSAQMLKDMPGKVIRTTYDPSEIDLSTFFGFILVEVHCTKAVKVPVLPFRSEKGTVIYPRGVWTGVYFSELLKEVIKQGYIIKPIKGTEFTREKLFTEYVEHFYDIKKNADGPSRFMAKMLLNQLYGYFGRKKEVIITENVDRDGLTRLLSTRYVSNYLKINDNLFVVLMEGNLNSDNIKRLPELPDIDNYVNIQKAIKSHVGIAAAVTAYGQAEMIKYKTIPGNEVYYSDTDSVILSKELPDNMVGEGIGQLKNELIGKKDSLVIDEFYAFGNKMYAYKCTDSKGIQKTYSTIAGVAKNTIEWSQVLEIAKGNSVTIECEDVFTRDIKNLDIEIKPRTIKLKAINNKKLVDNNYLPESVFKNNSKYSN